MGAWLRPLWRLPSAWLLLVQLVMLVTAPILSSNTGTHAFSWVLSALALLLVGVVIRDSPVFNTVGFILVGAALVLSGLVAFGQTEWTLWANIVEGSAYFYAAIGMILYMLADHDVTKDELFAAAVVFTLLAWGFAFAGHFAVFVGVIQNRFDRVLYVFDQALVDFFGDRWNQRLQTGSHNQ